MKSVQSEYCSPETAADAVSTRAQSDGEVNVLGKAVRRVFGRAKAE